MAKTRIDDLAQDTEELGATEQKAVKGGALATPAVAAVAAGAAGAGVALMGAAVGLATFAARHKAPAGTFNALAGAETGSTRENPLYEGARNLAESPLKKPGS